MLILLLPSEGLASDLLGVNVLDDIRYMLGGSRVFCLFLCSAM